MTQPIGKGHAISWEQETAAGLLEILRARTLGLGRVPTEAELDAVERKIEKALVKATRRGRRSVNHGLEMARRALVSR